LTLYNKRRPSEKHWIIIKLSLGYLTTFHAASSSRRSYHVLESKIARLLRDMDAYPQFIAMDIDIESEEVLQVGFKLSISIFNIPLIISILGSTKGD
jgi:hypothetical protein